ncbi:uncharacterized protein K460DRAFT_353547 [Cucurbitaria berberidis CBS 394.84]|uniref:Rhodopsin domain-containing protein n=1 Tax=Cucurbitaria berberidis CBS 394.84 TaxID=1168544 RepID=A0A9P4GLK2_9PLEO|nr:uncharacterized protein K460DRAFT_353547 [Cucurbitaria berberidis CBS 394.84]KAF1848583.1 hypothetical protein K460DRAFT_353547 [Cucurbitaria berberidis CBS 394.84]
MVIFPVKTSSQKAVLGVAFSVSVLAVIAVSLRLIAHAIAHKRWTPSDYFIIAACIFAVGLQSVSITGVFQAGIGYGHVTEIALEYGLEPITKLSQLIIPLQFLWVLSLSCTKISILYLYLKLFPIRWVVWSSYATIFIIIAWTIATILAGCFICRPFAFNWDKAIPGGSCGDQVTSFTVTGIINLITDVIVLLLPMRPLYQLQMATYKKVTLITVFGLGTLTCVISALRISILSTMDFTDITFTIPKANIFSGLEPCLAVVLASVPMMRPLLGQSAATPYGSGKKPVNTGAKSTGPKEVGDDGFERLDDDTSDLWLRPIGLQHRADASALRDTMPGDASEEDQDSLNWHERSGHIKGHGITVKQSFNVSERG